MNNMVYVLEYSAVYPSGHMEFRREYFDNNSKDKFIKKYKYLNSKRYMINVVPYVSKLNPIDDMKSFIQNNTALEDNCEGNTLDV